MKPSVLLRCVLMISIFAISGCRSNTTSSPPVSDLDAQQAAQKVTDLVISKCGQDSRRGFFPVGEKLGAYTLKVEGGPPAKGDTEKRFVGYEWIGSAKVQTKNPNVNGFEFPFVRKSGVWYYVNTEGTAYQHNGSTDVTKEIRFDDLKDVRPGCTS